MTNDSRLTDEQRELATENHNLIYWFASKKNVPIDDYYGVLAVGLCKAAKSFDKDRGEFTTMAYRCMANELNTYWRSMSSKSAIPKNVMFYYDAPVGDGESCFDKITDNDAHESMIYDIMSEEFANNLTDKERSIVDMLVEGLTHNEIADKIGCRRQNVSYHIKKIRSKIEDYLNK